MGLILSVNVKNLSASKVYVHNVHKFVNISVSCFLKRIQEMNSRSYWMFQNYLTISIPLMIMIPQVTMCLAMTLPTILTLFRFLTVICSLRSMMEIDLQANVAEFPTSSLTMTRQLLCDDEDIDNDPENHFYILALDDISLCDTVSLHPYDFITSFRTSTKLTLHYIVVPISLTLWSHQCHLGKLIVNFCLVKNAIMYGEVSNLVTNDAVGTLIVGSPDCYVRGS
jgi:hypothetical protein